MTVTSILYILLVISTNYQLSVQSEDDFHLDQMFDCPADDNTSYIDTAFHKLRSISLLSPCYPNSYYGQCMYQRRDCFITVWNIPDNMWIGLFSDEDFSVPKSNDELTLLSYKTRRKTIRINSLTPGYIHRFTQYSDNNYTVGFVRSQFPPNSADDESYKFKIDTKMAYVLGKSYGHEESVTAGNGGYIVSHEKFDYGTDINNYYLDDIDVELTLTGLSVNDTIRVTFLFFDLHFYYWSYYCYDYLEVTGIRGYPRNTAYACGDGIPTKYVYELFPVGESIKFRFVTSSYWSYGTSAGFLLEYKVMKEMKCPPQIQNANKGVQVEDTEVYIIECKVNHWIQNISNIQIVNCTSDIWISTILPCILIECELPEISTDIELNFTMSSRGRATVGTNISYPCNSRRYELTDGTEISTCTSNGEWSSPVPNCTLIETTDTDQKTAGSTAGYIGGGVGVVVVILIVVVVLLLLKRRKSRNDGRERSTSPHKGNSAAGIATTEQLGRTDMHATDRTDDTYTDVYELAESVENPESADVSNRNYEEVLTSPVDRSDISPSATARDELDVSNGPSAARAEVYELADATDDYDNHAAIERSERERDITYAPVLAVNKRKFTADDVDVMIDNELYGT